MLWTRTLLFDVVNISTELLLLFTIIVGFIIVLIVLVTVDNSMVFHSLDCMHVTSEEGEFVYKKTSLAMAFDSDQELNGNSVQMSPIEDATVCGLYVVAGPYKTVEITVNQLDASCKSGALLGVI